MFISEMQGIFHLFIHGYYTVIYFICQRIPIFFQGDLIRKKRKEDDTGGKR